MPVSVVAMPARLEVSSGLLETTTMPWRCPACQSLIQLGPAEDRPQPRTVYRCSVCRLELTLDADTGRLDVPPLSADDDLRKRRKTT
jgi:hypothetical protein